MPNILAVIHQSLKNLLNFSWQSEFSRIHLLNAQLLSNKSKPMTWILQNCTTGIEDSDTGRGPQMSLSQQRIVKVEQDSAELDALQVLKE